MAKAEEVKTVETVKAVEEVKVVAPQPVVVKEKYVTVKSKLSGKRFIGGTWYHLEKDKESKVTEDAKRSLLEAGAIYL